jgi:hypothetical protein
MFQSSPANSRKPRNKTFLSKVFGVLAVGIILIYGSYHFVFLPQLVTAALNQNIRALNDFNRQSKNIIEELTQIGSATDFKEQNTSKLSQTINQAKQKTEEIDQLVQTIPVLTANLQSGPNTDTSDFRNLVAQNISRRSKVLTNFSDFMAYQLCLMDYASQINLKNSLSIQKINQLSNTSSNQVTAQAFLEASQDFKTKASLIGKIKDCIKEPFKKYWQAEVDDLLAREDKYYNDMAVAMREVAEGSDLSNPNQIRLGVERLSQLEKSKSNFLASTKFSNLINESLADLQKQAEDSNSSQDELNTELSHIRQKYSITTLSTHETDN